MIYKLSRVAAFIDKFGLVKGITLYIKFKFNWFQNIQLEHIKSPFFLRKNTSDIAVFDQIFLQEQYDIRFSFIPSVIIDAGANIGLYSIFSKNKFPNAKIVCIESSLENFKILKNNLASYNDIFILNEGLWNTNTLLTVIDNQLGFSSLSVKEDVNNGSIKAITINTLMEKFGMAHIDILKIDIEGSEDALFFKNYETWLPKVRVIIIELHDWLLPGKSKPFFKAIQKTFKNYSYTIKGENTIIENLDFCQ